MKLVYPKMPLLLLAAALCTTATAGSYNHGHSLLVKTRTRYQGPHKLFRRQDDSSQRLDVCEELAFAEACTNGLFQDYANLLEKCNDPAEAQSVRDGCRPHSEGKYCGSLNVYKRKQNIKETCTIPPRPCSQECKNLLIMARSELGCCISVYNDSTSLAFANSLWTNCEVEIVTQECPESPIQQSRPQTDPSCNGFWSEIFLRELYSSVICREKYAQSLHDTLQAKDECKDHTFLNEMKEKCQANKYGVHCETDLTTFAKATVASGSCVNTAKCDPLCVKALNDITNTLGCCFNREYNDSTTRGVMFDWMRQEFWSKCGLEPLGDCEEKFTSDTVVLSQSASSTVILLAVMLMLNML